MILTMTKLKDNKQFRYLELGYNKRGDEKTMGDYLGNRGGNTASV